MDLQSIWQSVQEQVKDRVTGRSMWQAIDALIPITIEENLVVLGIAPQYANLIGHVRQSSTKNIMEQLLSAALESKVEVLVIEGVNQHDWELYKRKQVEARRLEEAHLQRRRVERESLESWDAIYEQMGRRFAETPARSLAQNRAKYLQEAVSLVREALQELEIENEQDERQFNRVIERIANNVNAPPAMIAWLILYGEPQREVNLP